MKKYFIITLISVLLSTVVFGAAEMDLSRASQPLFSIIIPVKPTAQEQNATTELKGYLDRITGGKFTVANESAKTSHPAIFLGATAELAKAFPSLKLSAMGKDAILIKTAPDGNLCLAGQGARGTLYAVYSFLEDCCGVRWWTPTFETVPNKPTLSIAAPDVEYTPVMDYRDAFYFAFNGMENVYPEKDRIRFAGKMKNNGFFNGIPREWGGNTVCLPGAWPTFGQLIPPAKYFKDHPDWFSEHNGKRDTRQLCLSNPEMRKEMARVILDMIKNNPDADMITITQNDADGSCECPQCKKIDAAEGSPAGLLLQCVNEVAAAVGKEHPGLYVNTLAYSYNLKEPKITKPRHNVSVQVCCPVETNRFDSAQNKNFYKTLQTWSKITSRLYAWTYLVDFGDMLDPIPNTFNLGPNLRILVDHKVHGVFAQGNSYSRLGDFPELKAWLLAKLLWNPQQDDRALIKEFMTAYYGPAAAPLHQYLELLDRAGKNRKMEIAGHNAYATPPALTPWLNLDTMNQATKLFDAAEKAVANQPEQLDRVRRARAAIDFQWIIGWKKFRVQARDQMSPFRGPKDQKKAFNDFFAYCQQQKVWRLCEGNGSLNILYPAIFGAKNK